MAQLENNRLARSRQILRAAIFQVCNSPLSSQAFQNPFLPSEILAVSYVCPRHHIPRILQTKTKPDPDHSRPRSHNSAVSDSRILFTKRWHRLASLGHTSDNRRSNPLRGNPSIPHLPIPTKTRETADGCTADHKEPLTVFPSC